MHTACPIDFIAPGDMAQPMDSSVCTTTHMGMVEELANGIPGKIDFGIGVISLIALVILLYTRVCDGNDETFAFCRVRYLERSDNHLQTFFSQVRQWISLRKRKDFAYCPA